LQDQSSQAVDGGAGSRLQSKDGIKIVKYEAGFLVRAKGWYDLRDSILRHSQQTISIVTVDKRSAITENAAFAACGGEQPAREGPEIAAGKQMAGDPRPAAAARSVSLSPIRKLRPRSTRQCRIRSSSIPGSGLRQSLTR
jgi:hypothetical protein